MLYKDFTIQPFFGGFRVMQDKYEIAIYSPGSTVEQIKKDIDTALEESEAK